MGNSQGNPLKRIVREVHRRSLWQVLAIYVAASWVVFEVVQTLTEGLGLPGWFPGFAFVLLLIGLPVVLATAFVQEGGPASTGSGASLIDATGREIERREPPTESASRARRLFTWRNAMLGGTAALALWGVVAAGWLALGGTTAGQRGSGPSLTPGSDGTAATGIATEAEPTVERDRYRASVAVLPFENMGAPDDLFLSEGMTEEIIAQLAQVTDLKVISRTSVVALQDASLTLPEIADTLGVEHVLEGSVQRNEDRARITVQLIEAETDAHLWAESYTRELVDLFGVQEEIARRVTQALVATVPELRSVSPASRPENAAAYEAYLKGRQLLHRRTRDSLLAAMAAFRRSYGLDPEYAPAYASHAAALTLWVMWRYGGEIDHYQAFGQALALSDRALSLDPENPTGHAVRGLVFTFASAPDDEAEASFRQALRLQENSADVRGWYAHFLTRREAFGRALAQDERAVELDPAAPGRRVGYALDALGARLYDLTLRQARAALVMEPGLTAARNIAPQALLLHGQPDECLSFEPSPTPVVRALCLYSVGRPRDARELVDAAIQAVESASRTPQSLHPSAVYRNLSTYYAWIGDVDEALRWVDRGFEASPKADIWRVQSGLFDRVRETPRFARRLAEIQGEVWDRVRRVAGAERMRLRARP